MKKFIYWLEESRCVLYGYTRSIYQDFCIKYRNMKVGKVIIIY